MAERAEGLIRIYAEKVTGKLLGVEMCAPEAEHLPHLLALAMERDLNVHDMLATPFYHLYHPVLEEGMRSALRDLARQLPHEHVFDLAHCPEIGLGALD